MASRSLSKAARRHYYSDCGRRLRSMPPSIGSCWIARRSCCEADSGIFQKLAADVLGAGCFATHAILYNKTATNNAAQPWHQDTTVKAEGGFVEAPDEVTFAKLLSLRLSLDDCAFADGALKLCPSSHKQGRLRPEQIASHAARPFSSPEMKAGDILLMNPLTIHASGASQSLKPRRVIHIVYAAEGLRSMLSPRRA